MGLLELTAARLRGGARFVPVGDATHTGTAPSTLHELLVESCGCHRTAGPLAYFEHREIDAALRDARSRLAAIVGTDPEGWADQASRTAVEVIAACEAAAAAGDVDVPGAVTLRPWCRTASVFTCRIPFIPLATVVHWWLTHPGPVGALVDTFDLGDVPDPWTLLDRVEPAAGRETSGAAMVEEIRTTAVLLRDWVHAQEPEVVTATQVFLRAADADPTMDLAGFKSWAGRR